MFKKTAAALALAGTLAFASASVQAAEVRPAAAKLNTQRVEAIGAEARATTRSNKENQIAMSPLLIALLAVGAVAASVAVVSTGGSDASPN